MTLAAKPNLAGMSLAQLRDYFHSLGEKPFRAAQVLKWIHQRGVIDIQAMTDISKPLRDRLASEAEIVLPKIVEDYASEDGSYKWIIEVASGSRLKWFTFPSRVAAPCVFHRRPAAH